MPKQPKRRVVYPWVKKKKGRLYKSMLAIMAERNNFNEIKNGKMNLKGLFIKAFEKTESYIPSMFQTVSKFYAAKGRDMNKSEFKQLCLLRLRMMLKHDKANNQILKLKEHPERCEKLKGAMKVCRRLIKTNTTYEKWLENKKK